MAAEKDGAREGLIVFILYLGPQLHEAYLTVPSVASLYLDGFEFVW